MQLAGTTQIDFEPYMGINTLEHFCYECGLELQEKHTYNGKNYCEVCMQEVASLNDQEVF